MKCLSRSRLLPELVAVAVLLVTVVAGQVEDDVAGDDRVNHRIAKRSAEEDDDTKRGYTAAERITLLEKHNEYRRIVSPTATDMRFMIWDQLLENEAQYWADECTFEHNTPNRTGMPTAWTHVGQNLYVTTSPSLDVPAAVTSWDAEKSDYTFSTGACEAGKQCGHYTQVVWAKSEKVGCGVRWCTPLKEVFGDAQDGFLVVCNYGIGGNVQGQTPFTEGQSASGCPSGFPTVENELCRRNPLCGSDRCQDGGTVDTDTCECTCTNGQSTSTCDNPFGAEGGGGNGAVTMSVRSSLLLSCLLLVASWMTFLQR